MQLMEGGELFDWIAARDYLTEADAREVFRQIADGVAHLHSIGIAHRDLKPQNVMHATVSEDTGEGAEIKIMDYDLARVNYSPEWQGSTPCGTVHYMAPEVVRREAYSLAVDCWSLGVILYILLCGCPPFHGKTDAAIEKSIERGEYEMEGEVRRYGERGML
jgi:serine/threonine protein kinase